MIVAAKRLILNAPDAYAWTDIAIIWDNAVHSPRSREGLAEIDYQTILRLLLALMNCIGWWHV